MEYLMHELFQKDLLEDERIQWVGQPESHILFTRTDIFLVPFSIVWSGFVIYWEIIAWESGPFAVCFGLPLFLIGLYILFGRFLYKIWKKKNTYYAVTNKRILILTKKIFTRSFRATYLNTIPNIDKSVRSDGIGTITFGNQSPWGSWYANTGMDFFSSQYGREVPTFYDIKDVNRVYKMVNEMISGEEPGEF